MPSASRTTLPSYQHPLTLCVYTWFILASLLASTSHGISYPNLYRNSAASPLARSTDARASAIDPVITQPTEGESLKMCDTDDGSISLSYFPMSGPLAPTVHIIQSQPTGTFFCDNTAAQFLPLTPTEVMLAAVIALKAYSRTTRTVSHSPKIRADKGWSSGVCIQRGLGKAGAIDERWYI